MTPAGRRCNQAKAALVLRQVSLPLAGGVVPVPQRISTKKAVRHVCSATAYHLDSMQSLNRTSLGQILLHFLSHVSGQAGASTCTHLADTCLLGCAAASLWSVYAVLRQSHK